MIKYYILFNNGVNHPVNKQNLSDYFIREFKKVERDNFYTVETFFPPLYQEIEGHKRQIETNFDKEIKQFKNRLEKAKRNELDFFNDYYSRCIDKEGIALKDYNKKENENCVEVISERLKSFSIENVISKPWYGFKLSQLLLIEIALKKAEQELRNKPQQESKKNSPVKLKDFFSNEVGVNTIDNIQIEFKEYSGKRLAMLLHRLVDLKLVTYLPKSKTKSRKHFVELLKNKKTLLSYENRILDDKNELKDHSTNDPDYIDICNKLSKTLEKQVV